MFNALPQNEMMNEKQFAIKKINCDFTLWVKGHTSCHFISSLLWLIIHWMFRTCKLKPGDMDSLSEHYTIT
jgi:hypothetical protein